MITSVYSLTCERALENTQTRNVSFIEVFTEFSSAIFPAIIPKLFAVFSLQRDGAVGEEMTADLIVQIKLDEEEIVNQVIAVAFSAGKPFARLMMEMAGLPILRPGNLRFILLEGDRQISESIIFVNSAPQIRVSDAQTPP